MARAPRRLTRRWPSTLSSTPPLEGKDTEDHFGDGMNMHADNDTSMAFDRVYDSRFEEKDTEDHFGTGMLLAADAETEALDSARRKQLEDYNAAKQAYEAGSPRARRRTWATSSSTRRTTLAPA